MIGHIKDLITLRNDYNITFSTPEGKRVLKDLMRFCGYRASSYVPNDTSATMVNEGLRLAILRILKFVEMEEAELTRLSQLRDENPMDRII
jgi:hypothetical protein